MNGKPQVSPETWRQRGRTIALPDGRIFALELGEGTGVPVLALHGFPTSSWDFAEAASALHARGRRVIVFDFLGFGLSDKPHDAGYSLFEQAEVAIAVARAFHLSRGHLWAHDMGTSVATELLARRERGLLPFEVASVALMNGSVHIDMAAPTFGQRILKSPAGPLFARVARQPVFVAQMIQYMTERVRFRRRWIGALERIDLPVLVAWGKKDPVARIEIAERLARETPGAELVTWDDLGHYPQVEDPERVAETIGAFFDRVDESA